MPTGKRGSWGYGSARQPINCVILPAKLNSRLRERTSETQIVEFALPCRTIDDLSREERAEIEAQYGMPICGRYEWGLIQAKMNGGGK